MDVKLLDNNIQSKLLSVSTSYISFDWNDTEGATVYVTTNFESTVFPNTTATCEPNSCITFIGNTTNRGKEYIVECNHADWLDVSQNSETNSFSVICKSDNEGENDRTAQITVSYNGLTKTIEVVQFANTSYVTYTITSNAEDGAQVKFNDSPSPFTTTLKDGIAEYTRRQVGSKTLNVTVSGGLPSLSVTYAFENLEGTTASTVSNLGQHFFPPLQPYKITTQYTYDEKQMNILTSTTVSCSPGERKNVEIYPKKDRENIAEWSVEEPDYSWVHSVHLTSNNHTVKIDANKNNIKRSAILTYYIDESPTTIFRYKVMQTNGNYTFCFSSDKSTIKKINSSDNNSISIGIDSYLNDEKNLIGFEAKYSSNEASVSTNSTGATINLKRNYLLKTRTVTINFIQNESKKRITLYITQDSGDCKIGDVYAYDATEKRYASFRFSNGESIVDGFTPVGVVVMPFNNGCTFNKSYARVISLTESKTNDHNQNNSNLDYTWYMRLDDNTVYETIRTQIGYLHLTSLSDKDYIGNSYNRYYMDNYPVNEYRALGSVTNDSYKTSFDNGQKLYYAKNIYKSRGDSSYDYKRKMKPFTNDDSNTNISGYSGVFKVQNENNVLQEEKYAYTDFSGKTNFDLENKTMKDHKEKWYDVSLYYYISHYSTLGTKVGDWYLGSLGEMSYVSVYSKIINSTLKNLASKYQITLVATEDNLGGFVGWNRNNHKNYDTSDYGYWTSTMAKDLFTTDHRNYYNSAMVVVGTGMIGFQPHQRQDNNHHRTLKRVRPMLMINSNGEPM